MTTLSSRTDLKDNYRQKDRDFKSYQTWFIKLFQRLRDRGSFRFLKPPVLWKNCPMYLGFNVIK